MGWKQTTCVSAMRASSTRVVPPESDTRQGRKPERLASTYDLEAEEPHGGVIIFLAIRYEDRK